MKTDANGELPAVGDRPTGPAAPAYSTLTSKLAEHVIPAPAAALPATTTVLLRRADTTRLVGVAVAHADLVTARHARAPAHRTQLEKLPLAKSETRIADAVSAPFAPPTAQTQSPSQALASVDTKTPAPVIPAASRQHKPHVRKDAALARAGLPIAPVHAGAATHLVQLGSFSSQGNAEHARQIFVGRDSALGHRQFVITQAVVHGHNFWRVAVMGFDATSAGQTCSAIRQHGGACFAYAAGHLPGGQALAIATPPTEHLARR